MQHLIALLCFLASFSDALRLEEHDRQDKSSVTEPEMQMAGSLIELEKSLLHHQSQKNQASKKTSEKINQKAHVGSCDCGIQDSCLECTQKTCFFGGNCRWCPNGQTKFGKERKFDTRLNCREYTYGDGDAEGCDGRFNDGQPVSGEDGEKFCGNVDVDESSPGCGSKPGCGKVLLDGQQINAVKSIRNKFQTRSTTVGENLFETLKDNPNTEDMWSKKEWMKLSLREQQEASHGELIDLTNTGRESWQIKDTAMTPGKCGTFYEDYEHLYLGHIVVNKEITSSYFCCVETFIDEEGDTQGKQVGCKKGKWNEFNQWEDSDS